MPREGKTLRGNIMYMKYRFIFIFITAAIIFAGCKTTEKNYRSAYDVAILKKQQEDSLRQERKAEMGLGNVVMEEDPDGARLTRIGDREVRALHLTMARADSVKRYAPAAAMFKMPANANAYARDLRNEGWNETRTAKSGERYFVILGSTDDPSEALSLLDAFIKANPGRHAVGLSAPLLLLTPGLR